MEYTICKICKHDCPGKGCEFSDSTFKKELIRGELVRCSGFIFKSDSVRWEGKHGFFLKHS